jgi:TolB-like protein/tetratricopeptide (TPR) repeat protein
MRKTRSDDKTIVSRKRAGSEPAAAAPRVPDHELLRYIGSGAFGEVWLARNILGSYRAVKIIYRRAFRDNRTFDKEFSGLQRFEPISREHDGFVDILHVGRNDAAGFFYYVMELADDDLGRENVLPETFAPKTLSSLLLQHKRLSVEECLQLGLSLTEALDRLHRQGLVHRDIKPSNIIFVKGVPKLADIGLVAQAGQQTFVGTDGYIPPEGPGTPQADLFALGKVLYQASTGMDRLQFPELPNSLAELPEREKLLQLNAVILKACDTDIRKRYQSAQEMHDDLTQVMGGQSIKWGWRRLRRSVLAARIAAVAGAAALLLGLAVLNPFRMTTKQGKGISLAVLPFVNMSPNQADEYLSDGMTEELITTLSKIPELQVKARTSSFVFKGKNEDVRKIGDQLRVGTLLEGSVSKAGDKLRITAQLIDVATGNHLWSQTYDREMRDIFAIRTEVAQQVAEALKIRLGVSTRQVIAKKPTDNLEAYQLYLQGRFYLEAQTAECGVQALNYFNQAIQLAPDYAQAHAGLADLYLASPDPKEAKKAKEAALRAVQLDAGLTEAHLALGRVKMHQDWDWTGAEKEFKTAIALNEKSAFAHDGYATFLYAVGRLDQALEEFKRALQLDPLSVGINMTLASVLSRSGQHDEAVKQAQRTLDLAPTNFGAEFRLAWVLWWQGNRGKAIEMFEKARKLYPESVFPVESLGFMYGSLGKRSEAERMIEALNELSSKQYVPEIFYAKIYASLGDKEDALRWLEKAYEVRAGDLIWLKVDRRWDNVRSDPRFEALLKKVGLEQ